MYSPKFPALLDSNRAGNPGEFGSRGNSRIFWIPRNSRNSRIFRIFRNPRKFPALLDSYNLGKPGNFWHFWKSPESPALLNSNRA